MKFGILTSADLPYLNSSDRSLKEVLEAHAHSCTSLIWNQLGQNNPDSGGNGQIDAYIIRSTWDYYKHLDSFLNVMKTLPAPLINPIDLVEWNSNKKYLLDLQQKNLPIVPTVILHHKAQLLSANIPWERIVAKPSVSASSYLTVLMNNADLENSLHQLEKILDHSELMLQPFISEIQDSGEISLIYYRIGNSPQYSHGVLKTAKKGEFRIQNEFGGSVIAYHPESHEKRFCENVLAAIQTDWVYARVDFIRSKDGPLLCELEMIEPELFMSFAPGCENLFYQAITEYLKIS